MRLCNACMKSIDRMFSCLLEKAQSSPLLTFSVSQSFSCSRVAKCPCTRAAESSASSGVAPTGYSIFIPTVVLDYPLGAFGLEVPTVFLLPLDLNPGPLISWNERQVEVGGAQPRERARVAFQAKAPLELRRKRRDTRELPRASVKSVIGSSPLPRISAYLRLSEAPSFLVVSQVARYSFPALPELPAPNRRSGWERQ